MDADVIIVGAGPAGCTAARVCAAAGLDTLLVERAFFPREKPCGGALSPRAAADLGRIFGLGPPWPAEFGSPRFGLRAHLFRRPRTARPGQAAASAGSAWFPGGQWLDYRRVFVPSEKPLAYLTRRAALDHYLLERVRDSGAEVLTGSEVIQVAQTESAVQVTVREIPAPGESQRPALLRSLRSGWVIGADGAVSAVARGLGRPGREGPMAECLSLYWPLEPGQAEAITGGALDFHFGLLQGGYGWAFPAQTGLALGVGALMRNRPGDHAWPGRGLLAAALEAVLSVYDLKPTQAAAEAGEDAASGSAKPQPQAWLVPLGGARRIRRRGRVLLAGDAAGTANPLTGEGIGPAVTSAELAAGAVVRAVTAERAGAYVPAVARAERMAAALGAGAGLATPHRGRGRSSQGPLLAAARGLAAFSAAGQRHLFRRGVFSRLAAMMRGKG